MINSWLSQLKVPLTSTSPRVHLDNVLRFLVREDLMTEADFVSYMNHTVRMSDLHYCSL